MNRLDYESVIQPRPRMSASTVASLVISSIGSVVALVVWFVGSGDLIGDAYAPLVAVVYGLPLSIATLFLVMFPMLLITLQYERPWKNRPQLIAFAMAAASTAAIGGTTLLCLFSPHTHGSGC